MLLQASNILDLPVASLEQKQKVGKIITIIVDAKSLNIFGFLVRKSYFIFGKKYFISNVDVLDLDKNGLVVKDEKNIIDPDEVVKVKKSIGSRFSLFRLPAITKNKQKLGRIDDFVIDTNTLSVTRFYLGGIFENKILESKDVYKITKKVIIFNDDVEKTAFSKTADQAVAS